MLLVTGFELRISGIRSNSSANWAQTTAYECYYLAEAKKIKLTKAQFFSQIQMNFKIKEIWGFKRSVLKKFENCDFICIFSRYFQDLELNQVLFYDGYWTLEL